MDYDQELQSDPEVADKVLESLILKGIMEAKYINEDGEIVYWFVDEEMEWE